MHNQDIRGAIWHIGVPVALQNLISYSLNFVDTLMISSISEEAVAAVGLANQLFFLLILIIFGLTSGGGVFISQFLGRKDEHNIKKTVAATLLMSAMVGMIAFLVSFFFPEMLMRFFIKTDSVVRMGRDYLVYASFSYFFTALSYAYMVSSRSTGNARLAMTVSAIAVLLNVVLDYGLIFGKLGLPAMGVSGAALATTIARVMEFGIILFFVYRGNHIIAAKIQHFRDLNKDFFQRLIRTSLPVVLNETVWALGVITYTLFLAMRGAQAVAAWQVMRNIFNFFEVAFFGLASSAQVLIGMSIGFGDERTARETGSLFMRYTMILTVVSMVFILVTAPFFVSFFHFSEETRMMAVHMMQIVTLFLFFKHVNLLFIVGIARGGGDTLFAMLIEMTGVWFVGVPLMALGTLVFQLDTLWLVALIQGEEVVKCLFSLKRYVSGKWMKNVIHEIEME